MQQDFSAWIGHHQRTYWLSSSLWYSSLQTRWASHYRFTHIPCSTTPFLEESSSLKNATGQLLTKYFDTTPKCRRYFRELCTKSPATIPCPNFHLILVKSCLHAIRCQQHGALSPNRVRISHSSTVTKTSPERSKDCSPLSLEEMQRKPLLAWEFSHPLQKPQPERNKLRLQKQIQARKPSAYMN